MIFTWEYPPRIVGKLAEYVSTLTTDLTKNHVEPYVVTFHDSITGFAEEPNGAKVTRVNNSVRTHVSLLTWVLTLNQEVERAAANYFYKTDGAIDVIDVYDWHFLPAAVTIKKALGLQFVYSVDSLEDHRSPGANEPLNMAIRGIEWLGLYESVAVTVKSDWMKNEVIRIHRVPSEKITVLSPSSRNWVKDVISVYKSVSRGADK